MVSTRVQPVDTTCKLLLSYVLNLLRFIDFRKSHNYEDTLLGLGFIRALLLELEKHWFMVCHPYQYRLTGLFFELELHCNFTFLVVYDRIG